MHVKFPRVIGFRYIVAVGFIVESKTATHDENHRYGARERLTFFALGCIKYTSAQVWNKPTSLTVIGIDYTCKSNNYRNDSSWNSWNKKCPKNKTSQLDFRKSEVQNQIFHKININYQNIFDLHEHTTYIQYMKSKSSWFLKMFFPLYQIRCNFLQFGR